MMCMTHIYCTNKLLVSNSPSHISLTTIINKFMNYISDSVTDRRIGVAEISYNIHMLADNVHMTQALGQFPENPNYGCHINSIS